MHSSYLDAIKQFEGFTTKANWDYAQFINGYGTKARFQGEVISTAEADRRFRSEISNARAIVEKAAPDVDEGTKAALTSLTFNAGTSWVSSGLGDAVRRGDLDAAREIFQQYNKAGGDVLPGLVSRRAKEAMWIGNPSALSQSQAVASSPVLSQARAEMARAEVSASASGPPVIMARGTHGASSSMAVQPPAAQPVSSREFDALLSAVKGEDKALDAKAALDDRNLDQAGVASLGREKIAELARLIGLDLGQDLRAKSEESPREV